MAKKHGRGYTIGVENGRPIYKCSKCRAKTVHERNMQNHVLNKHGFELSVKTAPPSEAASKSKESE